MGENNEKPTFEDIFVCNDLGKFTATVLHAQQLQSSTKPILCYCQYGGVNFITKINASSTNILNQNGIETPKEILPETDTEIKVLAILKKRIIDTNASPCILEMVYHKKCSFDSFELKDGECDKLFATKGMLDVNDYINYHICDYRDMNKAKLVGKYIHFLVLEQCDVIFADFLATGIKTPLSILMLKSFLFQLIYTLYVLKKVYPQFKHGDLHAQNIMLKFDHSYKFQAEKIQLLRFCINGKCYHIPYFGIFVKLIDFGRSSIPEEGIFSDTVLYKHVTYEDRPSEMTQTLHMLYLYGKNKVETPTIKKSMMQMAKLIDSSKVYKSNSTPYIKSNSHKISSYWQMLNCQLFEDYRERTVKESRVYKTYTLETDIPDVYPLEVST